MLKSKTKKIALVLISVCLLSFPVAGADRKSSTGDHANMDHTNMNPGTMNHGQMMKENDAQIQSQAMPLGTGPFEQRSLEPGQGAFATIAEIVKLLTADPATDWSKVNISALREHLIDMDELVLRARATTVKKDGQIVFTVTGQGRTLQAIQNMVPAHSMVLTNTTAWQVDAQLNDKGAIMTISSRNPMALQVVEALGFFGVMATGAHHQPHHLAMAKGSTDVHAHN